MFNQLYFELGLIPLLSYIAKETLAHKTIINIAKRGNFINKYFFVWFFWWVSMIMSLLIGRRCTYWIIKRWINVDHKFYMNWHIICLISCKKYIHLVHQHHLVGARKITFHISDRAFLPSNKCYLQRLIFLCSLITKSVLK